MANTESTLKYRRLAQELRQQIADGQLQMGDRLHSENQLTELYGVSRQTVRQAIALLEQEGLVNRVKGSGTYIAGRPRRLNRPQTKVIGVVMTYADDYIFPSIVNGINSYLSERGYTINLHITYNKRINEQRILRFLLDSPIDGLIIEPTKSSLVNTNQALYDQLAAHIPSILINCYYPTVKLPCIMPDNQNAVELATNYLIDRGHTRIGGIFKTDDMQGHLRFAGYAQAMQARGLPIDDDDVAWYTTEGFEFRYEGQSGRYILDMLRRCTAVVCFNDQVAVRLVQFARENGLSVPDDLSIVSFDDALLARVDVPLTTMAHPKQRVGRQAAENLLKLIDDPAFDATHVFPPELVERCSVRDLRGQD